MNICVYGASSESIDKAYLFAGEDLGRIMAGRGHTLVFGGGATGMMGAVARGVYSAGGRLIGIAPSFFNVDGILFEHCTELIKPDTMRIRKQMMEEQSDGFILTPGGIGSFDEFFEIITLKQLGQHGKPIVIYNIGGYYDNLLELLSKSMEQGFVRRDCENLYAVYDNPDETMDYLENYVYDKTGEILKNI